jgi:ClpP class serine protease
VWAGVAAKERGLVDHLGSFRDALQSARRLGGIPDGDDFEVEISGEPGGLFTNLGRLESAAGLSPQPPPSPAALLDPATRAVLRGLGVAPSVLFEPGPKAMLPWGIGRR